MKLRLLLGTSLSLCILLAGPAANADNANGKAHGKSAPAVQVQIDKRTGKKTMPDDSLQAELAAQSDEGLEAAAAVAGVPMDSQPAQINADGSMSAKVGLRDMKFAVVTVGEDGQKSFSHQSADELTEQTDVHVHDAGEK
jgi:hypothetical protein